jgi:hypothetical protein
MFFTRHRPRKSRPTCRLRLEVLEKREMLAAVADTDDWIATANQVSLGDQVATHPPVHAADHAGPQNRLAPRDQHRRQAAGSVRGIGRR